MTVQIRDSDGTVRLSGDLLASGGATGDVLTRQANGTYAPAAPSGAAPVSAVYSGNNVSIADNANTNLTFDTLDSTVDLLDTTDPANPTVLAAGTYLVSVWINSFPLTAAGWYSAQLILDVDEGIAEISDDSAPDNAGNGVNVCLSAGSFIPAGGTINLIVNNRDGVAARNFTLKNATIVFIPS